LTLDYRLFNNSDKFLSNWKKFYNRLLNKGIYHSPDYIRLLQNYLGGEAELFVYGDEKNFVYYPYLKKNLSELSHVCKCSIPLEELYDISSSWYYGGPLTTNPDDKNLLEEFRQAFHSYCLNSQIVSEFIRFDPYLLNYKYSFKDIEIKKERDVIYVDLTPSEESIFNRFNRKCKKNYRNAIRNSVQLKHRDNQEDFSKFIDLYAAEMTRKNAPASYFFGNHFFEQLFATNKNNTYFISIYADKAFAGGSIAIYSGGLIHDYLRATDPKYWSYRTNDYLLIENILYFKQLGFKRYDLQGGRKGVYEFKKSFSDLTMPFFIGSCVHLPEIYNELSSEQSSGNVNFFPAYRKKDKN